MPDRPLPRLEHWIEGEPTPPVEGDYFPVRNPLNDQPISEAAAASPADIDRAVAAAQRAFLTYRATSPSDREGWLLAAADLLEQRRGTFLDLLIDEIGSPIGKAEQEVFTALRLLRAAAGACRRIKGSTFPTDVPGRLSLGLRSPLGVAVGFTPFNVPLIKGVKHSALPLATGNTFVLMPSAEAPGLSRQLALLYHDAGIPAGTFNVVSGNASQVGDQLTSHPAVRFVGFTGSNRVGQHVAALCGKHRKRMVLEMGGKNPLVILPDADMEKAVQAAVLGSFLYQGQICMASSRIYVHGSCYEAFLEAFVEATSKLSAGDLRDPQTMIGPIINTPQRQRIRDHLDDARRRGATIHCGAEWAEHRCLPTILSGVKSEMKIHHEETFGPISWVAPIGSIDQGIAAANETPYGLSAAIFTQNHTSAMRFAQEVQAGMVHINGSTVQEEPQAPFGGIRESGFGRESVELGIDDLTEWKWVTLQME